MPTVTTRTTPRETALSKHLSQVFNYMTGGVALSGVVAYLVANNAAMMNLAIGSQWVFLIVWFAFAFFMQRIVFSMQPVAALATFAAFSALTGFSLAPLALVYTGASIATAFATAAVMFAGASAYGYYSKKSLSGWGTFLSLAAWGLIGLVVVHLVLMLFGVSIAGMSFAISLIAVPLFAAITAWEINTVKETFHMYGRDELTRSRLAIASACSLYMNFVVMFLHLLNLLGNRE